MKFNKIRTSSPTERLFLSKANAAGWNVLKRGWPDYLLWKENGDVCCVEVKRDTQEKLKREQQFVCELLSRFGIKVFMWKPKIGFKQIIFK